MGLATAIAFVICSGLALWRVPKIQVASLKNVKGIDAKDVFKAENDARATLAQILGGLAVLFGLYIAWRNITATTENLELANKNFELANESFEITNKNFELVKEGQITERFTKAIEQLGATDNQGKPKLELRLGGIYALGRIARDSERDHWPVMEVLTAYIRENAQRKRLPADDSLSTDIQAILTIIGRRERSYEKSDQNLDLYGANLHGANSKDAHLEGANLSSAHLETSQLNGAHLNDAALYGAHLESANLESANLTGAQGVTQEQINSAIGDATTKLPAGLVMPESWKQKAS
jgi:hypothetical protein